MTAVRTTGNLLEIDDIRTIDDVIEALRAFKASLGLSNVWCDELGTLAAGQTDKALGPTRSKGLSPFLFQMYCSLFAVKLKMVVDLDQAKLMEARWEGRDTSNVRVDVGRVSKKLIERAKGPVLKACGSAGGKRRAQVLSPKHRSEIARKGGKSRWRKHRKTMRERLQERKERREAATLEIRGRPCPPLPRSTTGNNRGQNGQNSVGNSDPNHQE